MMSLVAVTLILASSSYAADYTPEQNVIAIIYGQTHVFSLLTPSGWVLDRKAASEMKLGSFFYPKNYLNKKDNGRVPVYMYAQGFDKESKDDRLKDFIDADIKNFKDDFPALRYKFNGIVLSTKPSVVGYLYAFENMGRKYKEEVAYLDAPGSIITIVFSSDSASDYEKYHKDFDKLLRSYFFLGDSKEEVIKQLKEKNYPYSEYK